MDKAALARKLFQLLRTTGESTVSWSDDSLGLNDVCLDGTYDLELVAAGILALLVEVA